MRQLIEPVYAHNMTQKALDKAVKALMKMGPVAHKRTPKPAKKELNRKFKMQVDRKGNPTIQEVG